MKHAITSGLVAFLVTPALAVETVTCTDAQGEITFSYAFDYRLDQPIREVTMQLIDDFGYSTNPDHPKHDGEYVQDGFRGDDTEGGSVSWDDENGDRHHSMSFRIGRVYEAQRSQIGGVVAVGGGGLWTVTCQSDAQ
ncbi:hypothetical protein [Devosia lucknowensis]|nr:hypothetical protein [Devosia lucknowensis]